MAKNSQRPASVETVQGGVPPHGVKETMVVNGGNTTGQCCSVCIHAKIVNSRHSSFRDVTPRDASVLV